MKQVSQREITKIYYDSREKILLSPFLSLENDDDPSKQMWYKYTCSFL